MNRFLDNYRIISICLGAFVGIAVIEVVLFGFSEIKARSVSQSVKGVFLRQQMAENPYLLSQALTDFEASELIACTQLFRGLDGEQIFFESGQKPSCEQRNSIWSSSLSTLNLKTANGEDWRLSFHVPFGRAEMLLVRILRLAALILGAMTVILFQWRRRIQEEMAIAKTARLQEANEIYRQISHDLKGPISALNLLSVALEKAQLPESTLVVAIGRRLSEIVASGVGVAAINRLTLGEAAALAREVAEEASALDPSRKVSIEFIESSGLDRGAHIHISRSNWCRVVSNILTNAIEAGSDEIALSSSESGSNFHFEVSDNGRGMSAEIEARVGTEGFTTKAAGQGLGLFWVRKTIAGAQGSVGFNGSPRGFQVRVVLPVAAASPPA